MERHYGMDWLRIGAFALLILYHIGMVFVPWGFPVKTAHPLAGAEIPMFLTSPWRLTLLFVVSGYASRALYRKSYRKSGSVRRFVASRNARLLLPLLFGMAVVVPPQGWVELVTQHGYAGGFLRFWVGDYWRFGAIDGVVLPSWGHLWFVAYLWVYTLGLGVLLAIPGVGRLQPLFDRVFAGWRAVVVPALYFVVIEAVLFHRTEDSHDLVNDGVAHLRYVPAFLFGFALAGSPAVLASFARHWRWAAAMAVGCFLTIAALLVAWPDFSFPDSDAVIWSYRIVRHLETWTAIAALIGVAERFWNRDHAWRATLAEATFPFYVIHQTVIILVEFWLQPLHIGPLAEFAVLVPATVAGCWGFYLLGREVSWLRPLIGLKRTATAPAHERTHLDPDAARWSRSHRAQPDVC